VPFLTRTFSAEEFGNFGLVMGIWGSLPVIFTLWIDSSVMRFISRYQQQLRLFTKVIFYLLLLVSLLEIAIGSIIVNSIRFESEVIRGYYALAVYCFPFFALHLTANKFFQATGQASINSSLTIARVVGSNLAGIALIFLVDKRIGLFLAGNFFWLIILGIPTVFFVLKSLSNTPTISSDPEIINVPFRATSLDMLKFGMPIVGMNISATVFAIGDRYILNFYHGSSQVGIYLAAYMIAETIVRFAFEGLSKPVVPIVFDLWEKKSEDFFLYFKNVIFVFLSIVIPIVCIFVILRKPIRILINPSDIYQPIGQILPIIAASVAIHGLTQFYNLIFLCQLKSKLPFCIFLCGSFVNIGLNFIFIPMFGLMGAAYTTLATYALVFVGTAIILRRTFILKWSMRDYVNILVPVIIFCISLLFIWNLELNFVPLFNLAFTCIVSGFCYIVVHICLNRNLRFFTGKLFTTMSQ